MNNDEKFPMSVIVAIRDGISEINARLNALEKGFDIMSAELKTAELGVQNFRINAMETAIAKFDLLVTDIAQLKTDLQLNKQSSEQIKELEKEIEKNRKMISALQITWAKLLGAMAAGGVVGSGFVEALKGAL